ncbi:UNVERIFIED_CONTAM: hypothetical protein FKN15_011942 [Acipenser sinensis]
MFSFQSCKFKVQRSKEGTGRVALWRMGVTNSFTLETSFCGSDLGRRKGTHFSTRDLQSVGFHFCDTLLDYCDPDRTKVRDVDSLSLQYTYCLNELEIMTKQDVSLTDEAVAREAGSDAFLNDHEASSSGSDSSDSNGLPAHLHALASREFQNSKHIAHKSALLCSYSSCTRNCLLICQDPDLSHYLGLFKKRTESGKTRNVNKFELVEAFVQRTYRKGSTSPIGEMQARKDLRESAPVGRYTGFEQPYLPQQG